MVDTTLILSCKSGEHFAKKVYENLKDKIKNLEFEVVEDEKFLCQETKIVIKNKVRGKNIFIVQDVTNISSQNSLNDNIMSAVLVGQTAKKIYGAHTINYILPYLPYSRQDKIHSNKQEPLSLAYLLQMFEMTSPRYILTVDIHNNAAALALRKSRFVNLEPYSILFSKIKHHLEEKNMVLSPTDFSSTKRMEMHSEEFGYSFVSVGKFRDLNAISNVKDVFVVGKVHSKDVLIVDDMIDTGGTMLKVIQKLKESKAKTVSVYASHGFLTNNSIEKFAKLNKEGILDKLYLSNSSINAINAAKTYSFVEIIDISSLFSDFILDFVNG